MADISVNGTSLHYNVSGTGPPLILVHGFGVDSTVFRGEAELLSKKFTLYIYDHRGHGKSPKLKDASSYTVEQFSSDLAAFIEALAIENPILFGHSMGGTIVLKYILEHPSHVRALILASTFAKRSPSLKEKFLLKISRFLPVGVVSKPFAKNCLKNKTGDNLMRLLKIYKRTGKTVMLASALSLGQSNVIDQLSGISVPCLIIHGDDDRGVPCDNGLLLHQGIGGSIFKTISGGSHMLGWEFTEEYHREILAFLGGLKNPRGISWEPQYAKDPGRALQKPMAAEKNPRSF